MKEFSRAVSSHAVILVAGPKLSDVDQLIAFESEFQTFLKPVREEIDGWGEDCFEEFGKSPVLHPETGVFADVMKNVFSDGEK
eukprot:862449-Pyramimonas_sp.AAC.1